MTGTITTTDTLADETPPPGPKRVGRLRMGSIGTYLGVALIVIWGLAPCYWMIVTALRDPADTFSTSLWPANPTLQNFADALDPDAKVNFSRALLNSVIIAGATTLIALLIGVFTAYALSRFEFRGKYFVTGIILGASMFPVVALVTPLFQLFTDIGWIGSYQALIIPNISFVLPLTVYTLTSFFSELPWELEEAARMDGATRGQAFRLVMLPLAAPALFTTAILAFIATVNEYLLMSQLSSERTAPVTVAMARFTGTDPYVTPYASIMAGGTLVMVPLVVMVLVFQRRIISGLTAGGVKS